jgi:hypothetical protein
MIVLLKAFMLQLMLEDLSVIQKLIGPAANLSETRKNHLENFMPPARAAYPNAEAVGVDRQR